MLDRYQELIIVERSLTQYRASRVIQRDSLRRVNKCTLPEIGNVMIAHGKNKEM